MASIYLDNDISLRLAPWLQGAGHDIAAARDLGLEQADDNTQLLTAVRSARLLVTHNRRDFILLHEAWRRWPPALGLVLPPHPGILVLDQAAPEDLALAINSLLSVHTVGTLRGELFWWRSARGWTAWVVGGGWTVPDLPSSPT